MGINENKAQTSSSATFRIFISNNNFKQSNTVLTNITHNTYSNKMSQAYSTIYHEMRQKPLI